MKFKIENTGEESNNMARYHAMDDSIKDYGNDFIVLKHSLDQGGIEYIKDIFRKGNRIRNFSEYLEDQGNPYNLTTEEISDINNITSRLNEIAQEINTNLENLSEVRLAELIKESEDIIYGKLHK